MYTSNSYSSKTSSHSSSVYFSSRVALEGLLGTGLVTEESLPLINLAFGSNFFAILVSILGTVVSYIFSNASIWLSSRLPLYKSDCVFPLGNETEPYPPLTALYNIALSAAPIHLSLFFSGALGRRPFVNLSYPSSAKFLRPALFIECVVISPSSFSIISGCLASITSNSLTHSFTEFKTSSGISL